MRLDLNPSDPRPLYLQIAAGIRRLVGMGALRPGDRLPAVRDLAVAARVNRNTAARAVQMLEAEGVVRTRVGQGTFVADGAAGVVREARSADLEEALDRLAAEARALGLSRDDLLERVRRKIDETQEPQREEPST